MATSWARQATRRLLKVHRISGLLAAANLALLVGTGVLLLFEPEIEELAGTSSADAPPARIGLAQAVELARAAAPGEALVVERSFGDFPGMVFVGMSQTGELSDMTAIAVDMRDGEIVATPQHDDSFFGTVWRLHTELLAGARGLAFVGAIAMLMLTSLVTGAIIYAPMMRSFGRGHSLRASLADIHKVVGIAVLVWGMIVASTGIILAWGIPKARAHGVHALIGSGPTQPDLSGLDEAVRAAENTRPKARWWTIILPRGDGRYGVVMRGGAGLGKRVVTLAHVDGGTVVSTAPVAEGIFRLGPIHFAEFGGMPIKIVWAVFALGLLGLTVTGPLMRVARH